MESIATGAAANLSSDSAKGIFQVIKRRVKYVIAYQENVDKFDETTKQLIAKRKSVQQDIEVAERNVEIIKPDVELWCNKVDKAMDEALKNVKDLEDKAKSKCFIGLCPNIISRYKLSRKAEDDSSTFDQLLQECQFNGSVASRGVPKAIVDIDAPSKDFKAFESRQKVFNYIMEALKDRTTNMIGVYGKDHVGKTTLINEVARQVQMVKLFDSVVTATVNQNPNITDIQDQMAESLGLNLKEKSIQVRASRLRKRFKKEKKILVVLDEIWERLELDQVGIPVGDRHKGCKILMMSRDQDALSNKMDAEKCFEIGGLEEFEAWELFKKIVGDMVESDELRPIAIEVVRNCAGLPGVIARVARDLRNKQVFVWKDALRNKELFAASSDMSRTQHREL